MKKYKTDSNLNMCEERLTIKDYKKSGDIITKFKITNKEHNCCGNVRVCFTRNKAKLIDGYADKNSTPDYAQISSALALYRLLALYKDSEIQPCKTADFYKMNWCIALEHKETKTQLLFGEWKGGFQIFTPATSIEQLPKSYIRDTEELCTHLVSKKCPIDYDGVIAGTVA